MAVDDELTGILALLIGLAMSVIPALVLGVYWGPKLWRIRDRDESESDRPESECLSEL